ncbi:MAG: hypothetical protein PHD61_04765 [Bacteroidales bacterium]|nr:hypothetical protein [Lentimicrobiaceae bacterium]MDD5694600.1 hypothetical protein [Bacteroidales bacterium]
MKRLVFIITCVCYSMYSFAQEKVDTIFFGNYYLLIKIFEPNTKTFTSYEEGFFITFSFLDSSIITIQYGPMVQKPLTSTDSCQILSEFVLDEEIKIIKGICTNTAKHLKNVYYFREESYSRYNLSILYENVSCPNIKLFDNILDNIKIYKSY